VGRDLLSALDADLPPEVRLKAIAIAKAKEWGGAVRRMNRARCDAAAIAPGNSLAEAKATVIKLA